MQLAVLHTLENCQTWPEPSLRTSSIQVPVRAQVVSYVRAMSPTVILTGPLVTSLIPLDDNPALVAIQL